jgi:hypothetical protein
MRQRTPPDSWLKSFARRATEPPALPAGTAITAELLAERGPAPPPAIEKVPMSPDDGVSRTAGTAAKALAGGAWPAAGLPGLSFGALAGSPAAAMRTERCHEPFS